MTGIFIGDVHLRNLLEESRIEEAKLYMIKCLKDCDVNKEFQSLVADMLENKRLRGRQKQKTPSYWLEVGFRYVSLRDAGLSRDDALAVLETEAGKYGNLGRESLRRRVNFYTSFRRSAVDDEV